MEKKKNELWGKKAFVMSRVLFMILNLVVAVVAFSFVMGVVSGQDADVEDVDPSVPTPPDTSTDDGVVDPEGGDRDDTPGVDGTDTTTDDTPDTDGDKGTGGGWDWTGGTKVIQSMIMKGGIGAGIFGTIGSLAGGDDGQMWGALAGGIGGAVAGLLEGSGMVRDPYASLIGLSIAGIIFLITYKKSSEEVVEFHCLPWQAPIGGQDCQICNEFEHCSEYMCKSLGQACDIVNSGTEEQKCVWLNPNDVNSPIIKMSDVGKEHKFVPDKTRPSGTGVVITRTDQDCIRAFYPLEFSFMTRDSGTGVGEPSQCKIDYNLIASTKEEPRAGFDKMQYFVGGNELFVYNHTEKLSLPGPDAINAVAPELKNDGEYTLFIRCQDANGNFNQDAFSVSFCVDKGPDTTPPLIVDTNIPSGNPVQYNQTSIDLEVYVNEPSECRWSFENRDYDNMESEMDCSTNIWEMNNEYVYTCRTTLSGIKDREENEYYFRCKDKPYASEGDRNENKQSFLYKVIGTQPLNILDINPNGTIKGATDTIPIFLKVKTDNGYENGEALCYYYNDEDNQRPDNEEDYVLFHETGNRNVHSQRQDLVPGNYVYYIKCVDLGGNAAYNSIRFGVETDREAPFVVRVYKENGLKIITNEWAECTYSNTDCNYEVETGVEMDTYDNNVHTADWVVNRNYYVRCKDKYDNQPYPNVCSIMVRPSLEVTEEEDDDGWVFEL